MADKIIKMYNTKIIVEIVYNYIDNLIINYSDIQHLFCKMERNVKNHNIEIKEKDNLINLIGVDLLKQLEFKYPEILKIRKLINFEILCLESRYQLNCSSLSKSFLTN